MSIAHHACKYKHVPIGGRVISLTHLLQFATLFIQQKTVDHFEKKEHAMAKDLIGQQLGNYQLVSLLGRGGFAEVYLGQHVRLSM